MSGRAIPCMDRTGYSTATDTGSLATFESSFMTTLATYVPLSTRGSCESSTHVDPVRSAFHVMVISDLSPCAMSR
ncbi:hypothetical protein BMIN_0883 [Bifidobacterium minimum]|uniref:Uncharacterized protein n=1 Tax=Bifidobacterium minimum TaxID=1693 RepID=A0A087BS90_9BIFI|nr:hypothetical protein BMIN_0883 [Bifidobacterium minimum]